MSRTNKLWQALEVVPGLAAVEAAWRAYLGTDYDSVRAFFRPSGKLASSHSCIVPNGCGCEHEVIVHAPEDIVAVCRCESGCETFPLDRSDIVVYELDRALLDAAVAAAFGLVIEGGSKTDLHGTTRIGIYFPYAGFRFPAYLTIQLEPTELEEVVDGLLGRNDSPFILLAPTRDLCLSAVEDRLSRRRSTFVPLSENLAIVEKERFQLLRPLDDILSGFRSAVLPEIKDDDGMVFFPTPPDATWRDVTIRFKDGLTVFVKAKSASGTFSYTQMGMANKKSANPTLQWKLLQSFAEESGVMTWKSPHADRKNQKRREVLGKNLQRFFRIESDPIALTENGKGWRVLFSLYPDT
jgi:hypothetical protein